MHLLSPATDRNVRAVEENFWSLWTKFGEGPGCYLHQVNGVTWFDTPLAGMPYNGVLQTQLADQAGEFIDRVFQHYQARNVPFWWLVHPTSEPSDLATLLESRGLSLVETLPGMTLDLASLPDNGNAPLGVEITEVLTDDDLREAQEMIVQRWDVPASDIETHFELSQSFKVGQSGSNIRSWLAKLDGVAVSKVLLNIDNHVAGIHGVMTKPEARGKGIARYLTLMALNEGKSAGCDLAMLHSSSMARSLYEALGFKPVGEFKVYASASMHV